MKLVASREEEEGESVVDVDGGNGVEGEAASVDGLDALTSVKAVSILPAGYLLWGSFWSRARWGAALVYSPLMMSTLQVCIAAANLKKTVRGAPALMMQWLSQT